MQFNLNLYAYKCSVTGLGFNTGFFIDDEPFGSVEQARIKVKSLGFESLGGAHLNNRLVLVAVSKHEEMKYVQYENEVELARLSDMGLSLQQIKMLLPFTRQYAKANVDVLDEVHCCSNCGSYDVEIGAAARFNLETQRFDYQLTDISNNGYCSQCEEVCSPEPASFILKLTDSDVLDEYKKRGIKIDPDVVTDDWVNECCKCSISGEILLHDDEAYTNALTGLPLSDACSHSSPDGVYWYA